MFKIDNKTNLIILILNVVCLLYYSMQLLIFTNEFAINNIGFFNHAIAGLSEIIGVIFLFVLITDDTFQTEALQQCLSYLQKFRGTSLLP